MSLNGLLAFWRLATNESAFWDEVVSELRLHARAGVARLAVHTFEHGPRMFCVLASDLSDSLAVQVDVCSHCNVLPSCPPFWPCGILTDYGEITLS